jgi:hypothetical protein
MACKVLVLPAIGITQNFWKPKIAFVMIEPSGNSTFHGGNIFLAKCHGYGLLLSEPEDENELTYV